MDRHAQYGLYLAAYSLGVSLSFAFVSLADADLGDASVVGFVALLLLPHWLWARRG